MVECNCGKRYVGETKLKVKSQISQHQKTLRMKNGRLLVFLSIQKTAKQDSNGRIPES